MSVYQCMECTKYTDDLDVMPCGQESCTKFKPINVATIHYLDDKKKIRQMRCSVNLPNATMFTNSIPAVTCPKCLQGIKEDWIATNAPSSPEVTASAEPSLPEDATILDLGLPDHIAEALIEDKRFHFAADLIGFIKNPKNEFNVANLCPEDIEILKAALYL